MLDIPQISPRKSYFNSGKIILAGYTSDFIPDASIARYSSLALLRYGSQTHQNKFSSLAVFKPAAF
jgi:hypothetical protein